LPTLQAWADLLDEFQGSLKLLRKPTKQKNSVAKKESDSACKAQKERKRIFEIFPL